MTNKYISKKVCTENFWKEYAEKKYENVVKYKPDKFTYYEFVKDSENVFDGIILLNEREDKTYKSVISERIRKAIFLPHNFGDLTIFIYINQKYQLKYRSLNPNIDIEIPLNFIPSDIYYEKGLLFLIDIDENIYYNTYDVYAEDFENENLDINFLRAGMANFNKISLKGVFISDSYIILPNYEV